MTDELELDEVLGLLDQPNKSEVVKRTYEIPVQLGPIKRVDREMRCMSRRCGSPTYLKFHGSAWCTTHLINEVNRILREAGIN